MTTKNEEISEAWAEFFVSHALAARAIAERMQGQSVLSMDEYNVLLAVSRAVNGRIRFSELAEATVYTKSGITRIVRRFEEEGYIRREDCPEDRRSTFAVLTEKGGKTLKSSWPYYNKGILEVFGSCYSIKEAQILKNLLRKLSDSLNRAELIQLNNRFK